MWYPSFYVSVLKNLIYVRTYKHLSLRHTLELLNKEGEFCDKAFVLFSTKLTEQIILMFVAVNFLFLISDIFSADCFRFQ